jgi:hypothetical protein
LGWDFFIGAKMNTKICTKCGEEKAATLGFFHKHNRGKYGVRSVCKACRLKQNQRNKEKNKEKNKEYYKANKEKILEYQKKYYKENKDGKIKDYLTKNKEGIKERTKEYDKKYHKTHRGKKCQRAKEWYQDNKDKKLNYDREYQKDPKNRGKINASSARRRVRRMEKMKNPKQWLGVPDDGLIKKIYEIRPEGYHVDHMVSIDRGGQHHQSNLCYLPCKINAAKGAKSIEEFGRREFNKHVIYWQDALVNIF